MKILKKIRWWWQVVPIFENNSNGIANFKWNSSKYMDEKILLSKIEMNTKIFGNIIFLYVAPWALLQNKTKN